MLAREPVMRRLRVAYIADSQVYADLLAITVIGRGWEAGSANATGLAISPGSADDYVMTTNEVAAMAGVRPVTIRRAIGEGRISARRSGHQWLISAAEAARYARRHSDGRR